MFQQLRLTFPDGRLVQGHMHGELRIFMRHVHECRAHVHLHIQLFPALARQSFGVAFPRLDLASHELPQQPAGLVRRTAADHEPASPPDQSGDNFHKTFLHTGILPQKRCFIC